MISPELQTAITAARAAGAITLEKFGELAQSQIHTKEFKDFVTEVDKACEARISGIIRQAFPDDSMLCEEGTLADGGSGRIWIVDPLDGTLNFIHSFPVFSISIAMLDTRTGAFETGVVFQPVLDELFTAERGKGAALNGRPISVSIRHDHEGFLLATGLPFSQYHYLDQTLGMLGDLIHESAGIRRAGSAAIDLAYTACGRFDGFWEYRLSPWDFAAGVLLVREAGGIVTSFSGNHDVMQERSIIAGSAVTHPMILASAQHHFIK